jgi:hypothetical protein
MVNHGVLVKGVTEEGEDDFYGIIQKIYELHSVTYLVRSPFFIVSGLI